MKDDKSFNPKESTFASYFENSLPYVMGYWLLHPLSLARPLSYVEQLVGVDNPLFFKSVDAYKALKKPGIKVWLKLQRKFF